MRTSTFVYDDNGRPVSLIHAPDWTPEDRVLLMGLEAYEDSLCPGCGFPKDVAWHSEMDGWFEATKVVCQACTASRDTQAVYAATRDTRDPNAKPLPPFVFGVTTVEPDPPKSR